MGKRKKARLVEKHGDSIVINKKWCLRLLAFLLVVVGIGILCLLGPHQTFRAGAGTIATGIATLILAEFTDD